MVNSNPGFLSTLSATPNTRIVDGSDNIHSGIINSLNVATGGNVALSGFNITQEDGGTYTQYDVASGKILRNGLLVSVSARNDIAPGVGERAGNDWYATVVVDASNVIQIRTGASSVSTASVSSLTAGDIPVAIIKYPAGSDHDAIDRLVQFLGYDQTTKGLSAINSGSETLRINADGTLTKGGSGTITLPASGTLATVDQIVYTSAISQGNAGLVPSGGVATANIADDAVTYAKMQNVSTTDRLLGRDSSGAGVVEEISPANVRTMLGIEAGATADQSNAEIETAYNAQVSQVSGAEKNAGTATDIRRFSPADIKGMIDTHETDTNTDTDVSVANLKTRLNSDMGGDFNIGTQSNDTAIFAGHMTVGGNLTVNGTTTTINTETLALQDNMVLLNSNSASTPSENAGLEVERGNSTNVKLRWNESSDRWEFSNDGSAYHNIPVSSEIPSAYIHPTSDVTNITTSGTEVVQNISTNAQGHVTALSKRSLSLSDLGYTGVTDANKYVHPNHTGDVTSNADGATTIANDAVVTAKIADSNVTEAKIANGAITNGKVASDAAIAQSKISGLTSALSGKEPSLTIENGLTRTGSTLKININDASGGLTEEHGMDRTADFLMYDDGSVTSGNPLRRINLANVFGKLVAGDIPDISSAYRAVGTKIVDADIASSADIQVDKLSESSSTNNKLFTATLKSKLDGIATGATVGADWSSNVTNISVANSQLAGSIANAKLANSSVTINSNSLNLGGSLTLDTGDIGEGSNKYYTDERVDDRVNALITDGEGITTTYNDGSGTLTIDAEVATTSNRGVASFDSNNFDVSSGAVAIKASGITNTHLAGGIAQSKITNLVSNLASKIEDLSDLSITATAAEINILDGVTDVSATEIGYLDGVTSSIQTQLNTKLSSVALADLTDITGLENDIASVSSSHDTIPSAKATKAYVDAQVVAPSAYNLLAGLVSANKAKIILRDASSQDDEVVLEAGEGIGITQTGQTINIANSERGDDVLSASFNQGLLTLTQRDSSTITATLPDATTDAHGLMTDDQFDKLAGIEALADVTDKANVVASLALLDESDTLHIGDAGNDTTVRVRGNLFVDGTTTTVNQTEVNVQNAFVFEGTTADAHETTLSIVDPTADRTISLPDVTGTLITTGDTGTIATGMIASAAVTTGKINSNAITTGKLATGAVTTAKVADDAITGAKIDFIDDSIAVTDTHIMIADGTDYNNVAVSGDATLANDGTLTIANLAVETGMLANLGVTTAKIAADAITSAKIADDAIDSEHIANGAIDTAHIGDNQVTVGKISGLSNLGSGTVISSAERTKLSGIETSADVTDATNVAAAGALMDGDFTSNGFLKRTSAGSYSVDTNTYLTSLSVTGLSDVAAFETNFADGVSANDDSLASAKSIKAYVDSVGGAATGSTTFQLEDGDGTELTIADSKEIKFVPASSLLTINWTGVDNGTDADPYELTFTVNPLLSAYTNDSNFTTTTALNNATAATAITGKALTNLGTGTGGAIAATDTILAAMQKLETRTALNDAKVTNTDVNVNEANLRTRLADISSNVTIGDATDVTVTTSGALVVTGNLTVNGTTTTVNTNTVNIGDNIIVLNSDETGTPSQNAGIEVERGTASNKTLTWDETNDKWTVGSETFVAGAFTGDLTGDVTGDVTGNADTATTLATARSIAGQSFNGSADITIATTDLSDISALDTDLSSVSANDDSLATAKAIKTYVDAQVDTVDTIAELADINQNNPTAGQVFIRDTSSVPAKWKNAHLTAGTNVSITNGDGSITIASTDTTFTAASNNGLVLSGTAFSIDDPVNTNITLMSSGSDGSASNPAQRNANTADQLLIWDDSAGEWAYINLAHLADFAVDNGGAGGIKAFKTISVSGQDDIVADASADTLTLTAGSGITIANTAASDTITFSVANGDISNAMLANDSVSFGGVSLDLGQTDATPAFDLTDATNYPTSSLTGTITNAQLAGSIANAKLANSSITVSDGSNSTATALGGTITFAGTANEVEVAESSGTITVGLPSNVTLGGDLNVNGGDIVVGTGNNAAGIFTAGTGQLLLGNDYDEDDGNEGMIGIRGDGGVSKVVGISNTLQLMTDRNVDDIKFTTGTNSSNDGNTTDHVKIDGGTRTTHFYGANYDATIVDGKITLGAIGNVSGESSSILSVNSLGAVKINLDTNSNDTGSYFRVTEGGSGDIFNIDYAGNATVYGDLTVTGNDIKSSTGATVMTLSADDVTFADDLTIGSGNKLFIDNSYLRDDGSNLKVYGNTQTQYQVSGQYGAHIFYTQDGSSSDNLTEVFKVNYLGNLELGNNRDRLIEVKDTAHDAAGKDLTISAGDTTAGTTNNIAGGDLIFEGGIGKGTGAGGDIIFKVANAGSSGSSLNSLATAMTISDDTTISTASNFTVGGNLTVSGTTTTVNSNTVNIGDSIITLNSDETGTPSQDAGIEIERGTSTNKSFYWDESEDEWTVGSENFKAGSLEGPLTGNASTATALATARNIHGVSFDGTSNIDLSEVIQDTVGAMFSSNTETNITATYQDDDGTIDLVVDAATVGDGLTYNGTTANGILTYGSASTIDTESTLTYNPAGQLSILPASGFARIEMGGSAGAYIDMKNDSSDDYDARLITDGTGLDIIAAGAGNQIDLKTNGTSRFKVEDAVITVAPKTTFATTVNIGSTTNSPAELNIVRGGDDAALINFSEQDQADIEFGIFGNFAGGGETGNGIYIGTGISSWAGNSAPIMFFQGDGKVGMGTKTPQHYLDMWKSEPSIRLVDTTDTAGGAKIILGEDSNVTQASESSVEFGWEMMYNSTGNDFFELKMMDNTNGDVANALVVDRFGKVGIGTDGPSKNLDVAGDIGLTGDLYLAQTKKIYFDSTDTYIGADADTVEDLHLGADGNISLDPDGDVIVRVGSGTEYVRFDGSEQRVGIGTTSPDALLHVDSGSDTGTAIIADGDIVVRRQSDNAEGIRFNAENLVSTTADILFHESAVIACGNDMYFAIDSDGTTSDAFFQWKKDGDQSDTGSAIMTLTEAGNLGIGTTTPAFPLEVDGFISTASGIVHMGDTNNTISFGTDTQSFNTAGSARMTIASDGAVAVAGAFSAATKSFDIEHPTKEGKRLHHGSLEGPEHGVYIRGRLEGDVIELPDYWLGLVDEDTITVQLTPNKGFQQIYVDHIEDNKVYVGTQTDTPIDCFYFIQAERKDVEKMEVEYDAVV